MVMINSMRNKFLRLNKRITKRITATGYSGNDSLFNKNVNIIFALLVLLLTSPVSIILAILIKLQDGGPIFYKGLRFGKNKKEFNMYKFRTLVPDAEALIGAQLLKPGMGFETPIGNFLRETRLDELPQLVNVLKGDMVLIGPRPERPAVYEKMCKDIPNYDLRFEVKPGVIGYSQLFTPHSTNKKVRATIDNLYSKKNPNIINTLLFIVYSLILLGIVAIKKTLVSLWKTSLIYFRVHRFQNLRQFVRIKYLKSHPARLLLSIDKSELKHHCQHSSLNEVTQPYITTFVFDINDLFVSVISDYQLPILEENSEFSAKLIVHTQNLMFDRRTKRHVVFCRITHIKESLARQGQYRDTFRYTLAYEALSELNRYKLDKYILNKSIL